MNIDKAIEILTDLAHPTGFTLSADLRDAVTLGIESLKQLVEVRRTHRWYFSDLLPGETDDNTNQANH